MSAQRPRARLASRSRLVRRVARAAIAVSTRVVRIVRAAHAARREEQTPNRGGLRGSWLSLARGMMCWACWLIRLRCRRSTLSSRSTNRNSSSTSRSPPCRCGSSRSLRPIRPRGARSEAIFQGCHCWLVQQCPHGRGLHAEWPGFFGHSKCRPIAVVHCWTSQQWHPAPGKLLNGMNSVLRFNPFHHKRASAQFRNCGGGETFQRRLASRSRSPKSKSALS